MVFLLQDAGIGRVSFKPGSIQAIRDVCNIARDSPEMQVVCQWTGGRSGGHHSCEDQVFVGLLVPS